MEPKTKKSENYYSAVSKYLASKMKTVRYDDGSGDKNYEVNSVDLVKEVIVANDGKITIPLGIGLGTGKTNLAYLTSILHSDDGRKMIVLLDEVADMDQTTKGELFNTMNELYDESKLILGISCDPIEKEFTVKEV